MQDFNETDNKGENPITEENKPGQEKFEGLNPIISPILAAFIGLIGGFILYQVVGGLLTIIIIGFDLESASVSALRLMTMAGQILFILLPALLFAKWFYNDVGKVIRANSTSLKEIGLFSIGIIILTPLLQAYLHIQNHFLYILAENSSFVNTLKNFFDTLNEMVEKTYGNLLRADNIFEMAFVFFIIAVIPAVSEEVMFRGYIQKSFELKMKPFTAALITAIFFGLYHFNPYGIIPLILLGLFFGYAAYKSNSIIVPMVLHFLNNFIAIALFYVIGDDELIETKVQPSTELGDYLSLFLGLCVLFSGLIFLINKFYERRKEYAGLS
ncbi:MAG: CPBP family intramembrane metalloprotease [Ignavibacteriaceae bacterium]|nr:CPBP family intramembrane metalloprotease [Ignavibacteriaceae bacterium]